MTQQSAHWRDTSNFQTVVGMGAGWPPARSAASPEKHAATDHSRIPKSSIHLSQVNVTLRGSQRRNRHQSGIVCAITFFLADRVVPCLIIMNVSRPTIIAADDHPVVLSGIRLALRGSGEFQLLSETHDGASTLAAIEQNAPDLLILDLWMGGNDGIELLQQIHRRWPSICVLVYSMNDERSYGARALRAGAAGYLMKSHGLDELLRALRVLVSGKRYLSPELAAELVEIGLHPNSDPSKPSDLANLTDREIQVLRLIGLGHSTAAIGKELGISTKTVGAHRENLKNKLNVENATKLGQKAVLLLESRAL
jgi:DNA-binding NarL/FixJ family response regulator